MAIFSQTENKLIDEIFNFAEELVKNAGEIVREGFYKPIDTINVSEKTAKFDLVTEYDNRIEEHLINKIHEKYSDHKYLFIIQFNF